MNTLEDIQKAIGTLQRLEGLARTIEDYIARFREKKYSALTDEERGIFALLCTLELYIKQ